MLLNPWSLSSFFSPPFLSLFLGPEPLRDQHGPGYQPGENSSKEWACFPDKGHLNTKILSKALIINNYNITKHQEF